MFDDKVIIKGTDGSLLRGFSSIFFPNETKIEVMGLDNRISFVDLTKVYAVFFVRDFDGNPRRDRSRPTRVLRSFSFGKPVQVTLVSGEVVAGKTSGERQPDDVGLFLQPVDPEDNNINVFVPYASVRKVEPMAEPELAAVRRPHPALRR